VENIFPAISTADIASKRVTVASNNFEAF